MIGNFLSYYVLSKRINNFNKEMTADIRDVNCDTKPETKSKVRDIERYIREGMQSVTKSTEKELEEATRVLKDIASRMKRINDHRKEM